MAKASKPWPEEISYSRLASGEGPGEAGGLVGGRGCCCCRSVCRCVVVGLVVAVVGVMALVSIALVVYTRSSPLHASCTIDWKFGADCSTVKNKIISQIEEWKGSENCQHGGQKCLYLLTKQNESAVWATHETPKKHYIDDLTFSFSQTDAGTCSSQGYSTSEVWYAVLDMGTNYCNLHNLITGAALDAIPGYKETTSNSRCTQYTSRDCSVY